MSKIKVSLIGAGQRGKDVYGEYALQFPDNMEFVAIAEPNRIKREEFASKHNIPIANQFEDWTEMLEKDKLSEAIIIATSDDIHYEPAKLAIEKGYRFYSFGDAMLIK